MVYTTQIYITLIILHASWAQKQQVLVYKPNTQVQCRSAQKVRVVHAVIKQCVKRALHDFGACAMRDHTGMQCTVRRQAAPPSATQHKTPCHVCMHTQCQVWLLISRTQLNAQRAEPPLLLVASAAADSATEAATTAAAVGLAAAAGPALPPHPLMVGGVGQARPCRWGSFRRASASCECCSSRGSRAAHVQHSSNHDLLRCNRRQGHCGLRMQHVHPRPTSFCRRSGRTAVR